MFPAVKVFAERHLAPLRGKMGDRFLGIAFALLAEALLILVVVTMASVKQQANAPENALVSVTVRPKAEPDPVTEKPEAKPRLVREASPSPRPVPRVMPPLPDKLPNTVFIPLSKSQMASLDIAQLPRQPSGASGKSPMGPVDSGVPGDSKRVGSAPNGQAMYAAAWYREPYDDELRGYLSTAQGPGWALIACRTVANFRVEDCVGLDEFPARSNMMRAVLGAAWQFQVRPPRVGGVSKIGSWVRIRIEYKDR